MTAVLTRNDVVSQAKTLKDVSFSNGALCIGVHWVQILSAFVLFYFYQTWWTFILLLLFISARQYGLAILLHDAQHTLLHPDKAANNRIAAWLIAAPLGTDFIGSQRSHLEHHFNLGDSSRDPDYALYCFGEPSPKRSLAQVFSLFLFRIVGGKIFSMVASAGEGRPDNSAPREIAIGASFVVALVRRARQMAPRLWSVAVVQTLLLVTFSLTFGWWGYFLLWLLPVTTLAIFYNDFRIFCEHSVLAREATSRDERMISFISNPVERFFIAPNHMNYHAEHHLFPFVPHSQLPALRNVIRNCPELNSGIEWRSSYFGHLVSYLRNLRRSPGTSLNSARM